MNAITLNFFLPLASATCLGYSIQMSVDLARLLLSDLFLIMESSMNSHTYKIFHTYNYIYAYICVCVCIKFPCPCKKNCRAIIKECVRKVNFDRLFELITAGVEMDMYAK